MSTKKTAAKTATKTAKKTTPSTTAETDLLGDAPAPAAKAPKAEKVPKAPKAPKAEKAEKAEKAPKEPKVKKERKPRGEVRVAVDQEPTEVKGSAKLLKAASADLLAAIHFNEKPSSIADLAASLKTDAKGISNRAKPLIEAGLVVKDEKEKTLDVVGNRQSLLGQLLTTLRASDKPLTSAAIGKLLWADPKKPGNRDTVRFGRAAGRLLTAAFALGVVRQFTQPRRKFSAEKLRKLYTPTAE
jgi:hypothetical protein